MPSLLSRVRAYTHRKNGKKVCMVCVIMWLWLGSLAIIFAMM